MLQTQTRTRPSVERRKGCKVWSRESRCPAITFKTVQATFCLRRSGKRPEELSSCSLFTRKRPRRCSSCSGFPSVLGAPSAQRGAIPSPLSSKIFSNMPLMSGIQTWQFKFQYESLHLLLKGRGSTMRCRCQARETRRRPRAPRAS